MSGVVYATKRRWRIWASKFTFGGHKKCIRIIDTMNKCILPTQVEEYHNLAPGTVLESVQTEPALSDYIDSPVPWFDYFENNALQVESITTSVDLDAEVDDIFSFLEQYWKDTVQNYAI